MRYMVRIWMADRGIDRHTFPYPEHTPSTFPAAWDHQSAGTRELQLSSIHALSHPATPPTLGDSGYMCLPEVGLEDLATCLEKRKCDSDWGVYCCRIVNQD